MPLAKQVRDYLGRPGKDLAVVTITDVRQDYNSVFSFIEKIKEHSTETNWDTAVLGSENDEGTGNKIVVATYPSKIQEPTITGQRIYIVEMTQPIQPAIENYLIKP